METDFKAPHLPGDDSAVAQALADNINPVGDTKLTGEDSEKEKTFPAENLKVLPPLSCKEMETDFKTPHLPDGTSAVAPVLTDDIKPVGDTKLAGEDNEKEKTSPEKTFPAENLKSLPPLSYKEPSWSGVCSQTYTLEIVKNGVPIDDLKLSSKSFWVIGRLPQCDISMEHPSLSRYHAIIQYCAFPAEDTRRPVGWYLYDLSSTHGTTLNKQKISALTYHRLRVGYTFKFGGSSRLHILQGPEEDQELEISKEDVLALREKRRAQLEERLRLKAEANLSQVESGSGDGGCAWGMGDEDADDINPDAVNPFSSDVIVEELNLDDPKKTLRGWFEREGYDEPEYILEEQSHGRYKCTVDLPLDTPTGHPLKAVVSIEGKKKEAVVQCAMEACRILDQQGTLRQAKHESRKRKVKNWDADDYYDSDDDTFLDRTGDVERKRQLRMKRAGKLEAEKKQGAFTYDQLVEQLTCIETEMAEIQSKLDTTKRLEKERAADLDDLDAYMLSIKSGGMNATEKTKCKRRMMELKHDKLRTEKLINIARPNSLQELRVNMPVVDRSSAPRLPVDETNKEGSVATRNVTATVTKTLAPSNKAGAISVDKRETSKAESLTSNVMHSMKVSNSEQGSATSKILDPLSVEDANNTCSQTDVTKTTEQKHSKKVKLLNTAPVKPDQSDAGSSPRASAKTAHLPASSKRPVAVAGLSLAEMVTDLKTKAEDEELMKDTDYASWLPPSNQVGDGRTSLNDKYGY